MDRKSVRNDRTLTVQTTIFNGSALYLDGHMTPAVTGKNEYPQITFLRSAYLRKGSLLLDSLPYPAY